MIIPPTGLQQKMREERSSDPSTLCLRSAHLVIPGSMASTLFDSAFNVHLVYYPEKRCLLIGRTEDDVFRQLHKTKQHLLKAGTSADNRTIALHEILIDHQISDADRELAFEWQKELGILNVQL